MAHVLACLTIVRKAIDKFNADASATWCCTRSLLKFLAAGNHRLLRGLCRIAEGRMRGHAQQDHTVDESPADSLPAGSQGGPSWGARPGDRTPPATAARRGQHEELALSDLFPAPVPGEHHPRAGEVPLVPVPHALGRAWSRIERVGRGRSLEATFCNK